jgi:predicted transcriptional regulator
MSKEVIKSAMKEDLRDIMSSLYSITHWSENILGITKSAISQWFNHENCKPDSKHINTIKEVIDSDGNGVLQKRIDDLYLKDLEDIEPDFKKYKVDNLYEYASLSQIDSINKGLINNFIPDQEKNSYFKNIIDYTALLSIIKVENRNLLNQIINIIYTVRRNNSKKVTSLLNSILHQLKKEENNISNTSLKDVNEKTKSEEIEEGLNKVISGKTNNERKKMTVIYINRSKLYFSKQGSLTQLN